jgi:hypothetical protein
MTPTTYQLKRALAAMLPETLHVNDAGEVCWKALFGGTHVRDTEWAGLAMVAESQKAPGRSKHGQPAVVALLELTDPTPEGCSRWAPGQFASFEAVAAVRSAPWELRVAALVEFLGMAYVDDPEVLRIRAALPGLVLAADLLERKSQELEGQGQPYSLALIAARRGAVAIVRSLIAEYDRTLARS